MARRIEIVHHGDRRTDVHMPYAPGILVAQGRLVFLSGVTAAPVYHSHPHRDEEFDDRRVTRDELEAKWNTGWAILSEALAHLDDGNLQDTVIIRGVEFKVHEALHRSLAHTSYHVGQMVFLAKAFRGEAWQTLSIAPGASEAYNANPTRERPPVT